MSGLEKASMALSVCGVAWCVGVGNHLAWLGPSLVAASVFLLVLDERRRAEAWRELRTK